MDNINFKKVLDDGELFDQQANYEENFEKINQEVVPKITDLETNKVDKVAGKGLSTNDFDNTYKQKIDTDIPAQLAEKANKEQEVFITPTLLNGWVNYSISTADAKYYKDEFGIVRLSGMIKDGLTTLNTLIFALPAGYRPLKEHYFIVLSGVNVIGNIKVDPEGVKIRSLTQAYFHLSSISFRAEV